MGDFTEKKKIKWAVLLAFCTVLFACALIALIIHILPEDNNVVSSAPVSSANPVILVDNPINFAELKSANTDICAWIQIPNMNINYAILQSGADEPEDFYLNRNTEKKYKSAGSIYIQKINNSDFSDPNTVIYGHDMLNGSMFGTLKKFRNAQFFNDNSTIIIYTPGHILTYNIYSAFVYDDRHILNSFNFGTDDGFMAFIEQTLNPTSMVKNVRSGATVTTDDRIITLSTCTGRDSERYLVEGVLINDQLTK